VRQLVSIEKEKESTKLFGYFFFLSPSALFFFKGIDRIRRRRRSRKYNTARQRWHNISTHTF
jgi:hypothetical protein